MTKAIPLPDVWELAAYFDYCPETGVLSWALRPHARSTKRPGDPVGTMNEKGYIQFGFRKRILLAHRVIWKMCYGTEPPEIDHKNGNPTDNRIANLRAATRALNSRNRRVLSNNKLGVKGVYKVRNRPGFIAQITENGKVRKIGYFLSAEAAWTAYVTKARELYGEFANDGIVSEEARKAALLPTPGKKFG